VVEGDEPFELHRFDEDGTLVGIYRVAVSAPPPASLAMERFMESLPSGGAIRRAHRSAPVPPFAPSFKRLLTDSDGWTWALLFDPSDRNPTRWLVFDPGGEAVGVINLPNELEVEAIGNDQILGVWRDELRVNYVRRYRLSRQTTSAPHN
jgi:hypothetical protein